MSPIGREVVERLLFTGDGGDMYKLAPSKCYHVENIPLIVERDSMLFPEAAEVIDLSCRQWLGITVMMAAMYALATLEPSEDRRNGCYVPYTRDGGRPDGQ